jgi:hypothetical protein
MKLTDDVASEAAEALPEERSEELFYALLNGRAATEKIGTSRGEFTVKYPKQRDILNIYRLAALARGGVPAGAFDANAEYEIQKCAALDVMVVGGPDWYESAKKKDRNFTWKDAPDAGFTDELYAKALSFRVEMQKQLQGDTGKPGEVDVGQGVQTAVGDGVFAGTSGTAKRG